MTKQHKDNKTYVALRMSYERTKHTAVRTHCVLPRYLGLGFYQLATPAVPPCPLQEQPVDVDALGWRLGDVVLDVSSDVVV